MKKILIVEDHHIVRVGLLRVLQGLLETACLFDEATDGPTAIKMISNSEYDLVLLDISLPGQGGLEILKQIQLQKPKLPVIMLSGHPEEQYAVRAIKAGAAGYVNKGDSPLLLTGAIERVLRGEKYISATQTDLLIEAVRDCNKNRAPHETLSDRELQMACMVTAGLTPTEIASKLNLSVQTVSTYRARVLFKLNLRTTADIINYCNLHNLTM